MNDQLLENTQKQKYLLDHLPQYNPQKCPPDLNLAELHHKATKVGKLPTDCEDLIVCPCCGNVINKEQYSLMCNVEEFAGIGMGYTLFFILYKYFALILLFFFVISGGAFFFMVSFQCTQSCLKFYGIPIISEKVGFSSSQQQTQVIHILTAVLILMIVIIVKHKISRDIQRVETKIMCPSQYTIMIQNLPTRKLDLDHFKKWIFQHLNFRPISINIAYDTNLLFTAKKLIEQLQIQKNKLIIKRKNTIKKVPIQTTINSLELTNYQLDHQIDTIRKKIQYQKKIAHDFCNNQIQIKEIGTVFVTFDSAHEVETILQTHQKKFLNIFPKKVKALFYSNTLEYLGKQIVFRRAPSPKQVIWQNLQFSFIRNIFFDCCFLIGMILFLLFTFRIQFWLVSKMYQLKHEGELTGNKQIIAQAIFMSIVIMVLNMTLRMIIQLFTQLRKFYSYTKQQTSFCNYYSLIFIVNSCLTIYFVHGAAVQSSNKLLLIDIHTIMLVNAFSEPLFKIFDPIMWIRMFQKFKISKTSPQNNPYVQSYIQRLWQGYEISNADNYQYIMRILFITVWFSNIAPLGILFSLLGMLCDYWIIKFLFIKVYKQPKNLSKQITKSLNCLELLPLVYIGGIMPFLYQITFTLNIQMLFNVLFRYGIMTIIILLCILGYLCKFRPVRKYIPDKKYSDIELAFGFNYETQNPITQLMGQKKFLRKILKQQKSISRENLIRNILDEAEMGNYTSNNSYVNKLKLALSRKVEQKVLSNDVTQIEMKEIHHEDGSIRESFPMYLKRKNQKF